MIPKGEPGFRKRSCSNKELEREGDSKKGHPALGEEIVWICSPHLVNGAERIAEMGSDGFPGALRIAGPDRRNPGRMFGDDAFGLARIDIDRAHAIDVAVAGLDDVPEFALADGLEQQGMELLVGRADRPGVVGVEPVGTHLIDGLFSRPEIITGRVGRQRMGDFAFERDTKELRSVSLLYVDERHQGSGLRIHIDQPLLLELQQGFADRGLADAEAFGECRARKGGAGFEVQRDDVCAQQADDLADDGLPPVEAVYLEIFAYQHIAPVPAMKPYWKN